MGLEDLKLRLEREYTEKTRKSRELYVKASRYLPAGVTYSIRSLSPHPFYVKEARGCRVWDVDGNEYVDYWVGHGALFLGHAFPPVVEAVKEQVSKGSHFGFSHELEVELASIVCEVVPKAEMVRFTNSGTEANMYAVRLARTITKRDKLVKFEGGWHGGYDSLHKGVTPPYDEHESGGLLEEALAKTILLPFNDLEKVEEVLKKRDVAAVFVEPVLGAGGCIPAKEEFLKGLREVCEETDTLLVFDEVITGFRLALGGAQEYYGVTADLVVFGKILGGGYPIGALVGGREYMERLDHKRYPKKSERAFHGGTFTGNPISMIAGITTLNYLKENREVYGKVEELTEHIVKGVEAHARKYNLPVHSTYSNSILGIHFTLEKPTNGLEVYSLRWNSKIYPLMNLYFRVKGIAYQTEHMTHLLLSTEHHKGEVEEFVRVFEEFLSEIVEYADRRELPNP